MSITASLVYSLSASSASVWYCSGYTKNRGSAPIPAEMISKIVRGIHTQHTVLVFKPIFYLFFMKYRQQKLQTRAIAKKKTPGICLIQSSSAFGRLCSSMQLSLFILAVFGSDLTAIFHIFAYYG